MRRDVRRRVASGKQRGKMHSRRPAFCASLHHLQRFIAQADVHHFTQKRTCLLRRETQLRGAQLTDFAAHAQPRQSKRRVGPCQNGDVDMSGQMIQQIGDRVMHRRRCNPLILIQDDHQLSLGGSHGVDQAGDGRLNLRH